MLADPTDPYVARALRAGFFEVMDETMRPLTPKAFPYTGPYGLPSSAHRSKGLTAEALKRAMGRMGFLAWTDFDQHYNRKLEAALDLWDPGKDGYGEGRWEKIRGAVIPSGLDHAGEFALDRYARKLVQDEAGETSSSTDEARVMVQIEGFWRLAIANAAKWGYSQDRPFRVEVDPAAGGESDCSAMPVQAAAWAGRKTGVEVVDPSKNGFSGFGNTDLYEDDWPVVGSPFRIGDLAHFHSERHVIQCVKAGTVETAEWGSNGREAAPELIRLPTYAHFPSEFLFVVRPDLVVD